MMRFRDTFGQVSLEYLVILGFALLLLIPVVSIFQISSAQSEDTANSKLILLSGRAFLSNAETVFYQGKNSRVKVELFFPENIQTVRVYRNATTSYSELAMIASFNQINSSFVFFSPIDIVFGNATDPCSGSYQAPDDFYQGGNKEFFVQSCGGNVSIYEVQP